MKNLNFLKDLHIYFVGIGGISMSGLAKLSHHFGAIVSGSDSGNSPEIHTLISLGIVINSVHKRENISADTDLLVYSGAIKDTNSELLEARSLGVRCIERSEFLGEISMCFERVIAISGTHGKTTTTAILGLILKYAQLDPTIHLGGESLNLGGNTIIGGNKFLVLEACEYRESFRYLKPYIGVITNIELDHLDYYPDFDSIHSAFERFAERSEILVSAKRNEISHQRLEEVGSLWRVDSIEYLGGGYSFNVFYRGEFFHSFRINTLGIHNITNALFAIAIAHILDVPKDTIERALADFVGVERRYERIKTIQGHCNVIIDYAHHPTELKASIEGLKGVYERVLYVFQPHTFSRTLCLFDDFVSVLDGLDNIVLFETYPAREEYIQGGSAEDIYRALSVENKAYIDSVQSLVDMIESSAKRYDCVLVLGAGDLAEKLKEYYI